MSTADIDMVARDITPTIIERNDIRTRGNVRHEALA